ncbi:MAG: enoyl-CoA hydratase/isomerase family protein [Pseudomonadota bacterium]|jgi:enoyl-CoA hydratase
MATYKRYRTMNIEIREQIATIRFIPYEKSLAGPGDDTHWDVGDVLNAIRADHSVRIVVMTGDEANFLVAPGNAWFRSDDGVRYMADPDNAWLTFTGVVRTHMTLAEMEKPVIAKVNGDAIGFGASLALGSDLIVANRDARICHMHMAMAEHEVGPDYGLVPGDGGGALIPLLMSPAKAKEWLMLGPMMTAAELADHRIINDAVAREELDAKVDALCDRLLKRSAYALAWTKRIANRHVVQQLNMTLDAGVGYEMVCGLQYERAGRKNKFSLQTPAE